MYRVDDVLNNSIPSAYELIFLLLVYEHLL
jgi:hypothetical protein